MPIFLIGIQGAGGASIKLTQPFHFALNSCFFFNRDHGKYFKTIEYFWIGVRVSGPFADFGSEGAERLKKARGRSIYEVDLVVPQHRWEDASFDEFRTYLMSGVRDCFEMCVAKAIKAKELLDEPRLRADFEAGFQRIMQADPQDDVFTKPNAKVIFDEVKTQAEAKGLDLSDEQIKEKLRRGIFDV